MVDKKCKCTFTSHAYPMWSKPFVYIVKLFSHMGPVNIKSVRSINCNLFNDCKCICICLFFSPPIFSAFSLSAGSDYSFFNFLMYFLKQILLLKTIWGRVCSFFMYNFMPSNSCNFFFYHTCHRKCMIGTCFSPVKRQTDIHS